MDKNKNIVPHNMQQTLDGSIKSITSGSKLSILQESKEKMNKRIDETLKEIEEKDKKIKKLEVDIVTLQNEFRGNQNVRGSQLGTRTTIDLNLKTTCLMSNDDLFSIEEIKRSYNDFVSKQASLQKQVDDIERRLNDGEELHDSEFDAHTANVEALYKIKSSLKRFKTNNSKLTQHELQLFELKEVEKESNK